MRLTTFKPIRKLFSKKYNLGNCNIVQPGIVSKERWAVPAHIVKPFYYDKINSPSRTDGEIEIKTESEIAGMCATSKLAANILKKCSEIVKIGVSTDQIDEFVYNEVINHNAYPSPLRYCGFPKSICTSVNNIACHGIPDDRQLLDGDIINIDITTFFNNFHGDCSKTFLVGDVDERGKYLVHHNEIALMKAIEICRPGQTFNEIGSAISKYSREVDLRIVTAFIGHGIGSFFHGPPEILHYENNLDLGVMKAGMTFTIEPILSLGSSELELWNDKWTTSTIDGSRCAQFEHTLLITESGCDILTLPD